MNQLKYWICTILIATIVVLIYHIIIVYVCNKEKRQDNILFFGIPCGPTPPKRKDIDPDKKMTGIAYIYDARTKTYVALKDEDGDKLLLDDIIFSNEEILDTINKFRVRANQTKVSKDELISTAKNLGYKIEDEKEKKKEETKHKINDYYAEQSEEFQKLYLNNMTTEQLYN